MPSVPEDELHPEEKRARDLQKHAKPIDSKLPILNDLIDLRTDRDKLKQQLIKHAYEDPKEMAKAILLNQLGFAYQNNVESEIQKLSKLLDNLSLQSVFFNSEAEDLDERASRVLRPKNYRGSKEPSVSERQFARNQQLLAKAYIGLSEELSKKEEEKTDKSLIRSLY